MAGSTATIRICGQIHFLKIECDALLHEMDFFLHKIQLLQHDGNGPIQIQVTSVNSTTTAKSKNRNYT